MLRRKQMHWARSDETSTTCPRSAYCHFYSRIVYEAFTEFGFGFQFGGFFFLPWDSHHGPGVNGYNGVLVCVWLRLHHRLGLLSALLMLLGILLFLLEDRNFDMAKLMLTARSFPNGEAMNSSSLILLGLDHQE